MSSIAKEVSPQDGTDTLTILSYNVGLLRFRLLGLTVYSVPPYANERLPSIPNALREFPADILTIQECYEISHAKFICAQLKDLYPYHARVESGGILKFHNGLLFLSKYPIISSSLQAYKKVSNVEKHLATKSNLVVEVDVPCLGKVTFVNMHTTAGGEVDPEHPDADADREDELRQAVEVCNGAHKAGKLGIIVGDLNCGPEASQGNFNYVLQQGFRDTYAEAQAAGTLLPGPLFTWDPTNYLNTVGPHSSCPGQRCDHVLLPQKGMEDWTVQRAQVLFADKVVDIGGGRLSTLSDHHGLQISLKKSAPPTP